MELKEGTEDEASDGTNEHKTEEQEEKIETAKEKPESSDRIEAYAVAENEAYAIVKAAENTASPSDLAVLKARCATFAFVQKLSRL